MGAPEAEPEGVPEMQIAIGRIEEEAEEGSEQVTEKKILYCALRFLCENFDVDSCNKEAFQYVECPLLVKISRVKR